MDARRFDALARALSSEGSRRNMLRGVAGLVAGAVATRGGAAQAGGEKDNAFVCPPCPELPVPERFPDTPIAIELPPEETPVPSPVDPPTPEPDEPPEPEPEPEPEVPSSIETERPYPAQIHAGTCTEFEADPALQLFPVGMDEPPEDADVVGPVTAVPVPMSATLVDVDLDGLLEEPHAIVVYASEEDRQTVIACGDIGGERMVNDLAVGVRERGSSGFSGVAWLRGDTDRVFVYVFVAQGLGGGGAAGSGGNTENPAGQSGAVQITEDDVNLRSGPSTDMDVVAVLEQGRQMVATGPASDGWVPVTDPATGETGFVSADFVESQG